MKSSKKFKKTWIKNKDSKKGNKIKVASLKALIFYKVKISIYITIIKKVALIWNKEVTA